MKFRVIDCEQRSDAWKLARLGRLTGSCAADMLTTRKDGQEAAGRRNLRVRLALERITGRPQEDDYQSLAMRLGAESEPAALAAYEAETGAIVTRTGFLACEACEVGCSLDGHVGDFEGIIEAKRPKAATHLEYLRRNRLPPDYETQVLHNLWVTGAKWCDFVSHHDAFESELQFFCVRVYREEFDFTAYEAEVRRFLAEVAREEAEVRELAQKARARKAAA